MNVTRLQVTYRSPEVDDKLDKKILQFFNKLDFVCVNREYNHLIWERRLDFEKHTNEVIENPDGKEIEHGSKRDKEAQLTT